MANEFNYGAFAQTPLAFTTYGFDVGDILTDRGTTISSQVWAVAPAGPTITDLGTVTGKESAVANGQVNGRLSVVTGGTDYTLSVSITLADAEVLEYAYTINGVLITT